MLAGVPRPAASVTTPYAELRETHSSLVFLVQDRAYKLKKNVDLGFLDFSTREKRLDALRRELSLNRRLAPDVYLGISDVTDVDNHLMDHLLVMLRMPDQSRLSRLVLAGEDVGDKVREVARVVASFHSTCARSPQISREGSRDALWSRWEHNLTEAEPFAGTRFDEASFRDVWRLAEVYLAGRAALFDERIRRGAIVDGHGDLLAEDIFLLPDGPRILDCLEFDDSLRRLDRLDDVACLAMDLERLGSPAAAKVLLDTYLEIGGDVAPPSLVHHYIAYRAFMRAKVSCLPHGVPRPYAEDPQALVSLAESHLNDSRVRLVLVGGPPGTGKTTVAGAVADALGWAVLSSDRIRKEVAGLPPESSQRAEFEHGLYAPAWTERTYAELLSRAEQLLSLGESVVLDATWSDPARRDQAEMLADRTSADLTAFRCEVADAVADARLLGRASLSDADEAVAGDIRARFHAWPSAITVDTGQSVEMSVERMRHRLQPWRSTASVARPRTASD